MKDYEKAQIYYEYAFSLLDTVNDNELEKIELAVAKSLIKNKIEPDETIESILLLAYDYYEKELLYYSKVQIAYHLAEYYIETGRTREALTYFKECLKESREREFLSHLIRGLRFSDRLFKYCLSNKIEEEFINSLKILKAEV